MSTSVKIAFPPPPPTVNTLTSQQRTQLLRTTKKLGRVLGTTPHLIDTSNLASLGPLHVHLPFYEHERYSAYRESRRRSSSDSTSSDSSSTSRSSSAASFEHRNSLSSDSSPVKSRPSPSSELFNKDAWPSRLPLLRLARAASLSDLETIPASPPADSAASSIYSHSRSRSIDGSEDTRFTLRPTAKTPRDSLITPDFTIPSANSIRRQKMDRIRRKLGDGVPLDLVFPREDDGIESKQVKEEKGNSSPSPAPRNPSTVRISYTRDSISMDSPSPHRARRRKPPVIVTLKASRPAPPPPAPHQQKPKKKDKLCVIIESPDEHGSGCSEEFGVRRSGSESPTGRSGASSDSAVSEWYLSEEESPSEVNVWSTRKGYAGWEEHAKRYERRRRSGGRLRKRMKAADS